MVPHIISKDSVTVVLDGQSHTLSRGSVMGGRIIKAIQNCADPAEIKQLLSLSGAVVDYSDGDITIKNNVGYFNGEALPDVITKRLLECMRAAVPYTHLLNFIKRLQANPSQRATKELYSFLEHKHLPITPQGTILAYKAVRNDWTDKHSGKFDNSIGNTLSMKRNAVDDDANRGCSYGFHAGSLEYAAGFGYFSDDDENSDRLLIVEVDPADVVSIPYDCACQKLRTCRYKVVSEYQGPLNRVSVNDADHPYDEDDVEDDDFMPGIEILVIGCDCQ